MKIKLTLTEEMLGTKPADKEVFATYIASKAPDGDKRKEELDTAESREETGTTVFHRDSKGRPIIYDYMIKGMFKDACGSLNRCDGTKSKTLKAYKTTIDGVIFVSPRQISCVLPKGGKVGICERPLRCQTPMGPRVALARSETVPAGTTLTIDIEIMAKSLEPIVKEWLDYGSKRGLGAWRNSGKGKFTWKKFK